MKPAIGCWQTATGPVQLVPGQIDLWRFRVDLPEEKIEGLKKYLSSDELQRAARLLIAEKRQQFMVARFFLRQILSRYLDCSPAEPVFCYGPHGKPELLHKPAGCHFNLAHSGIWVVLAVSCLGEVGVDLEKIDPSLDYQLLADKYFSASEKNCLQAAPRLRRRRIFYRLWTRKEAVLKLAGCGFSTAAGFDSLTSSYSFSFPLTKNYLGALSSNFEITSINRLQLAD